MTIRRVLFAFTKSSAPFRGCFPKTSPLHRFVCLPLLLICFIASASGPLSAEAAGRPSKIYQAIKQRGEVAIGVKTDFAPFGFFDPSGAPVGLEVDLARRMAADLGVALKLVSVTTENRFQRLEQGAVDIIIATAGDTQERRHLATAIEPGYYAAGVNVLLRPDSSARTWQDLRGRPICALHGAYFNRGMTQRHILDLLMFRSVRDALLALQDGLCVGFLYTDVAVNHYLSMPDFALFKTLDETALVAPWAISIARSEGGTDFAAALSGVIANWHRSGLLIELEKRWNVRASRFVQDAHELWRRKDADGAYICAMDASGNLPVECRNKAFVTSADVEGEQRFGLWLKEQFHTNLSIIYDPFDRRRYTSGLLNTLILSFGSIACSLLLGLAGAWLIIAGGKLVSLVARPVVNIGRMTPPILQMYLLFFGLGGWLHAEFGISPSPLAIAILSLGLYHGSIIISTLLETAQILKLQNRRFRVSLTTIPDLLAVSAVGIRSTINNLIKATTIGAAISVPELLSATIAIISDQGNPEAMMPLLLVVFYVYTAVLIAAWMRFEKRLVSRRTA